MEYFSKSKILRGARKNLNADSNYRTRTDDPNSRSPIFLLINDCNLIQIVYNGSMVPKSESATLDQNLKNVNHRLFPSSCSLFFGKIQENGRVLLLGFSFRSCLEYELGYCSQPKMQLELKTKSKEV